MDAFLYYFQMFLTYAIALSQIAMYILVAVLAAKVAGPAVKALKTYVANKDACNCGCGCNETPAQAEPAVEAPKAE